MTWKGKSAARDKDGVFRPLAIVYMDRARGLALIRGRHVRPVLEQLGAEPKWSQAGRGLVVSAGFADDLAAYAEWQHELVVTTDKPPPP